MFWYVNFEIDFYFVDGVVFLDWFYVGRGVSFVGVVCVFFGKFWYWWDDKRLGLGVCDVDVEVVEFILGYGVDCFEDVFYWEKMVGCVEEDVLVGEFGGVGYWDGGVGGVLECVWWVLVEELGKGF